VSNIDWLLSEYEPTAQAEFAFGAVTAVKLGPYSPIDSDDARCHPRPFQCWIMSALLPVHTSG
jgi:hypothetical protein